MKKQILLLVVFSSLFTFCNSPTEELSESQAKELTAELQKIKNACDNMPQKPIFFLGNTNAGKSTIITYLLGGKIEKIVISQGPIKKVAYDIKQPNPNKYPKIGHNPIKSQTDQYKIYGGNIVDSPGDLDTRRYNEVYTVKKIYRFNTLFKNSTNPKKPINPTLCFVISGKGFQTARFKTLMANVIDPLARAFGTNPTKINNNTNKENNNEEKEDIDDSDNSPEKIPLDPMNSVFFIFNKTKKNADYYYNVLMTFKNDFGLINNDFSKKCSNILLRINKNNIFAVDAPFGNEDFKNNILKKLQESQGIMSPIPFFGAENDYNLIKKLYSKFISSCETYIKQRIIPNYKLIGKTFNYLNQRCQNYFECMDYVTSKNKFYNNFFNQLEQQKISNIQLQNLIYNDDQNDIEIKKNNLKKGLQLKYERECLIKEKEAKVKFSQQQNLEQKKLEYDVQTRKDILNEKQNRKINSLQNHNFKETYPLKKEIDNKKQSKLKSENKIEEINNNIETYKKELDENNPVQYTTRIEKKPEDLQKKGTIQFKIDGPIIDYRIENKGGLTFKEEKENSDDHQITISYENFYKKVIESGFCNYKYYLWGLGVKSKDYYKIYGEFQNTDGAISLYVTKYKEDNEKVIKMQNEMEAEIKRKQKLTTEINKLITEKDKIETEIKALETEKIKNEYKYLTRKLDYEKFKKEEEILNKKIDLEEDMKAYKNKMKKEIKLEAQRGILEINQQKVNLEAKIRRNKASLIQIYNDAINLAIQDRKTDLSLSKKQTEILKNQVKNDLELIKDLYHNIENAYKALLINKPLFDIIKNYHRGFNFNISNFNESLSLYNEITTYMRMAKSLKNKANDSYRATFES